MDEAACQWDINILFAAHFTFAASPLLTMAVVLELNHIALLQDRAKNSGDTILFKLPRLRGSEASREWTDITVAEFAAHVERVASHLMTELKAQDIPAGSVIGVL
jgi:acyl-CoA synthetase (AMP-forming)/AMP-acid ligase II